MASFTPTVTFLKYLKNDVVTDISSGTVTIASGTMTGYEDEDKYVYNIAVDPFHSGTTTVDTHEFWFTFNPNAGTENVYMTPLTSGLPSGSKSRLVGYDTKYTWASGSTSGSSTIDVNTGFVGSGAIQQFGAVNDTGTTWTPDFGGEGDSVMDVPTIFQGSFVLVVSPADWDENPASFIHDFQLIRAHVGHDVQMRTSSFISGTYENNAIELYGSEGSNYDVTFKSYHMYPNEWEWYSGSTRVVSGTHTHTDNQWETISGLPTINASSGSQSYTLKLFANGSVAHPIPVRSIGININLTIVTSGRFGIGRFGIGRFGLD